MENEQWWVFTFGVGSPYADYVVKIYGTYGNARKTMFEAHGDKWCEQYSPEESEEMIDKCGYHILSVLTAD